VAIEGYTNIPINDEIVTEILPLHTLQAAQLVKDLADLVPRSAIVTANESGNSIIMTGQQKDVRRIDEIINSLDGSALSEVEVFPLQYADSKAVADELKEVFQSEDSDITRASTRNNFRTRGGGGFGGGMAAMFGGGDERGHCQRAAGLHAHDYQRHCHAGQTQPGGHHDARVPLEPCRSRGNLR
jgi:hypothetical protein